MVVYELTHIFYRDPDGLVYSPKNLGLYYSYESVQQAVQYFSTQPGFCEALDAFSIRERDVFGKIIDNTVFEVLVYLHSANYEFETEVELGIYDDEATAQNKLNKYCGDNVPLVTAQDLIVEKIVNKRIIEKREWAEGFSISD
jgi:hypothetical protein